MNFLQSAVFYKTDRKIPKDRRRGHEKSVVAVSQEVVKRGDGCVRTHPEIFPAKEVVKPAEEGEHCLGADIGGRMVSF